MLYQPTSFRLKPLNLHLAMAWACLPLGAALLYSPQAAAATCAAANSPTNTISADCEDLTWTSGSVVINNNAIVSKASVMTLSAVSASGTLGDFTLSPGAQISGSTGNPRGLRLVGGSSVGTININGQLTVQDTALWLSSAFSAPFSTVSTINNTGTILSQSDNGIGVGSGVTVTTINNISGVIIGHPDPVSYAGISNAGTIGTLNNGQMGLTYRRNAPTNYNIYIDSPSNYGTLTINQTNNFGISAMNFGIATGSTIQNNHLYAGVIQIAGTTTFDSLADKSGTDSASGYSYTLQWNSATSAWDLLFGTLFTGPSSADTQISLEAAASALRSVYKIQSNVINASLAYDCTEFGENQICISGGGRFALSNDFSGKKFSTLLVAAYQTKDKMRIGAFIDQNAFAARAIGIESDKSPMYGIFGVWHQQPDSKGLAVRLAASYSDQSISQTREVTGTSEAGMGKASLKSQALTAEVSYAQAIPQSAWIAQPYLGVRQSSIQRSGYTESNAITAQLTYAKLKQTLTTAMAGVRVSTQYQNGLHLNGHLGVEQELNTRTDKLQATGVSGLSDIDFSGASSKTRPTASLGVSYATAKNQRIKLSVLYRAEAFKSSSSTTGMLMYEIGL